MAKLADIMTKKGGTLLLTRELTGKACLITEDITTDTEIRENEDGKYLCVQIKVDNEIRDWNPTIPQFKTVVHALGAPETLKGKVFQVTGSIKDGFKSRTTAVELRGDYAPEQQTRLAEQPVLAVKPQPEAGKGTGLSDLSVFLGAINAQPNGQVCGDSTLDELAWLVCNGDVTKANFVKGVAITAGKIRNDGGCWSVVK